MYLKGRGVLKDTTEAIKWLELAAEQGNVPAQNNLGHIYLNSEGALKDFNKALKWYQLAAKEG